MKQIIILIFLVAFTTVVFAQPGSPRLDADLKRLNRRFQNVETIKRLPKDGNTEIRIKRAIQTAENELGRFKEKYPKHNVSKFENALSGFKNPQAKTSESSSTGSSSSSAEISDFARLENFVQTIEEIIKFNAGSSNILRGEESEIAKSKQQIIDFRKKMEKTITPEFLSFAKDTENKKIKRSLDRANNVAKSMESDLSNYDIKRILDETDQNVMLLRYFRIAVIQEKLTQLAKIFGNDINIKTANDSANSLIGKLGNFEDIKKLGEKNYAIMVAKNRMFPERQNIQSLRNEFTNAFKASVFRNGDISANSTILKVHLVSSGWSVQRNKITGIIISRDQQTQIAFKATNGKCYTYLALMQQNYKGGGKYGGAIERSGSQREILCSNVPK